MGGDDDDGDSIVETQEISSENLFQQSNSKLFGLNSLTDHNRLSYRPGNSKYVSDQERGPMYESYLAWPGYMYREILACW
eukprot:COSAG01_NODE_4603_length_4884_cov_31.141902_2_plen_80_part_00